MNLNQCSITGMLILALMLTVTAGCASTPKPVKCDGRLDPINHPALPANTVPVAKAPSSVAPLSQIPGIQGNDTP